MKIVKPSFTILGDVDGDKMLKAIERAGRICYKSEDKITTDSAIRFVRNLIARGHESVLEHQSISVHVVCDRGVSHEIVRHRIASYSQESTRYCNYSSDKFDNMLTFISPCFWNDEDPKKVILTHTWTNAVRFAEEAYLKLIANGATPQEARTVLPNSLKTEIGITMNLREWRHFCRVRTHISAHPQMREIAVPLLCELKTIVPVMFEDIEVVEHDNQ